MRKLGTRQLDVLRAAAAGRLARYDDGGWHDGRQSCTPAARGLAERTPALFVEGDRTVQFGPGYALGRRDGRVMLLTEAGRSLLAAHSQAERP